MQNRPAETAVINVSVCASHRSLDPCLLFLGLRMGISRGEGFPPWCAFLSSTYWASFFRKLPSQTHPPSPTLFIASLASVTTMCGINLNSRVPCRISLRSFSVGPCLRSYPCLDSSPLSYVPSLPGTLP